MIKLRQMWSCLLWTSKQNDSLRCNLLPSEGAVKIVEMATKSLKYNIDFVDKAVEGFERVESIFKGSSVG